MIDPVVVLASDLVKIPSQLRLSRFLEEGGVGGAALLLIAYAIGRQ
jgi:hypothetical protein